MIKTTTQPTSPTQEDPEYSLVNKLNKVGLIFKYILFFMLFVLVIYSIYIFTFSIQKLSPTGDKNTYKKAIINIAFQSKTDFEHSQKYLANYQTILYNKTHSKYFPTASNYIPIYEHNLNKKGTLFSTESKFSLKDLNTDTFYFFKHFKDETAYTRGNVFTPKLAELYSGKVVFEAFLKQSFLDFAELVSGIIFSQDLYQFTYSEQLKTTSIQSIKKQPSFFIPSYNNTDASSHEALLNAYNIYYKGDFFNALDTGNYFIGNDLVASTRYFHFDVKGKRLTYSIHYKGAFSIYLFRDGHLIKKMTNLQKEEDLQSGLYHVIIVKKEKHWFQEKELFWVYLNFKV